MNQDKKDFLKSLGFQVTTVREFLGLTKTEEALIETQLVLAQLLPEGHPLKKKAGIKIDDYFRALLKEGVSLQVIGEAIKNIEFSS